MRFLIVLILIEWGARAQHIDPDKEVRDHIQTHSSYSLDACKVYNKDRQTFAPQDPTCTEATAGSNSLKGTEEAVFQVVRDKLMNGFQAFLLTRIQNNMNLNKAIIGCLTAKSFASDPSDLAKQDCEAKKAKAVKEAKDNLPRLRQEMALMGTPTDPVDDPSVVPPEMYTTERKIQINIAHTDFGAEVPPLTKVEIATAIKTYDSETVELKKTYEKNNPTVKCSAPCALPDPTGGWADMSARKAEWMAVASGHRAKQNEHAQNYDNILNKVAPNLPFLKVDSVDAPDFNQRLAESFQALQASMQAEYNKIQGAKSEFSVNDLARYGGALNDYLETLKPPSRPECDIAQVLTDWIRNKNIIKEVGIGAIAAVGTGLCVISDGAGCAGAGLVRTAVASAALSQSAAIGNAYFKAQAADQGYQAGSGTYNEMKQAHQNLRSTVDQTPLAFAGTGAIGEGLQVMKLASRAGKAASGELAASWRGAKALTTTESTNLSAKLSTQAAMRSEYDALQNTVVDLAKNQSKAIPMNTQDQLMTNINRAIANSPSTDRVNVGFFKNLVDKVASAPVGSPEAKRALADLDNEVSILRYANAEAGTTFRDKLTKFLGWVKGKMGSISDKEQHQLESCLLGRTAITEGGSGMNSQIEENSELACWKRPPTTASGT